MNVGTRALLATVAFTARATAVAALARLATTSAALVRLATTSAALASLSACAPALGFEIDGSCDGEAVREIRRAGEEWNAVTNAGHKLHFDGGCWLIVCQAPAGGWNGNTSREVIRIAPNPVGATIREVAKHELGHALGLRHLCQWQGTGPAVGDAECVLGIGLGVMDPANVTGDLSEADLAECREAGAC